MIIYTFNFMRNLRPASTRRSAPSMCIILDNGQSAVSLEIHDKSFYTLRTDPVLMFTGIVEGTGKVMSLTRDRSKGRAIRMTVDLGKKSAGLTEGQSVAMDGVCLTVTRRLAGGRCTFDVIGQTARLTSLGSIKKGDSLNIERSMRANARIEGHFVLGHVDGTAKIARIQKKKDESVFSIDVPATVAGELVTRGSVAINGVSMTVARKSGRTITVCVIPHTLQITNLGSLSVGDKVNVETDVLAKYAQRRKLPK